MSVQLKVARTLALVFIVGFTALPAGAISFGLSSPDPLGIDVGFACLSGTSGCSASPGLTLVSTADATGTFTVVGSGIATADLTVTAIEDLVYTGSLAGIESITISGLTWSFDDIPMIESPLGSGLTAYTQTANELGSVSGVITVIGTGGIPLITSSTFLNVANLSGLTCSAPTGQCGFSILNNLPITYGGLSIAFTHQANLLVPEPGPAALVATAAAVLALPMRRRGRAA